MLRNYFKIASRNLNKNKTQSIINLFGLATGIAFTLIIGAYILGELQVNAGLKNADNQYIIQSKWKNQNLGYELTTLGPLAKTLKEEYPNLLADYYRFDAVTSTVSKDNKHFRENLQIGDRTMLSMFGFSLLYGDAKTALNDPYSVVITENAAIKYFGKTDVIGQTLTIENFSGSNHDFIICGVMKKNPKNSVTMIADNNNSQIFLPFNLDFFRRDVSPWTNKYIVAFVELKDGVTPEELDKPMRRLIKDNAPEQISENLTTYLVPLKKYYLDANNGIIRKLIYTLFSVAIFILLMAVINYINLAISKAGTRTKEIAIRKVLGGIKKQLIFQFLTESAINVFLSTIFAVLIYIIARNYFSSMFGDDIPELTSYPIYFVFLLLALSLIVGLLAGIYPAFILSSLRLVESLKSKFTSMNEKIATRKLLVGFQFATATVVFICSIIISQQISFFFSSELGYNKDYIITAQVPRDWSERGVASMETIRNELAQSSIVRDASLSYEIPNGNNNGSNNMFKPGQDPSRGVLIQSLITDEKFADTYQIPMAAGRYFNTAYDDSKSLNIVINESAAKAFNWTSSASIGNKVKIQGSSAEYTIVGVIKNFHFGSMLETIQPIWFTNIRNRGIYRYLSIRLNPGDLNNAVTTLQKQWTMLMPNAPFEYQFMDDTLKRLYITELKLKKAAYTAATLATIIALLGVIGLLSFNIQKRIKEIGIRKVLGSSVTSVIVLFIKEFLPVIFIASILACPFTYLIMRNWLDGYAYKIIISVIPFIIAISFLILVTIILIVIQTIKTANLNPVESLRYE